MRRPVGRGGLAFARRTRAARAVSIVVAVGVLAALAAPVGAAPPGGASSAADPSATPVRVDESTAPSGSLAPQVHTSETPCDGYTVRVVTRPDAVDVPPPLPDPPASLTVRAQDGTAVHTWTAPDIWSYAQVAWCRDVLGDGTKQLAYSVTSGGQHCCWTFVVLQLGSPVRELLRADLLDAFAAVPKQLDGSGPLELVAPDYRLEYLGDVPFVDTDPFPRIWAYRGGRYVEATRSFPAYLKADQKKSLAELAKLRREPGCATDPYCLKGWGLNFVAVSVLLGQPTSAISRLPLSLALRRWMLRYRPVVARLLGPK
jgi:hypothetical protein